MDNIAIGKIILYYYRKEGYNNPKITERTIELPLADYFINRNKNNLIEIGAVSPYYFNISHKVVDLYDTHEKAVNIDAMNIDYTFMNVLSISTIEHVGNGDYKGEVSDKLAFELLLKIIKESNEYLLTIPLGYNKILDKKIEDNKISSIVLKRINANNEWAITKDAFNTFEYGKPYSFANAICLITNIKDFLN